MSPIRFMPPALEMLRREAVRAADGMETGGMLLGHDPDGEGVAVISTAGGPGPRAERSSTFFRRDLHHAQDLASEAFHRSGALWIGEWHTHLVGGTHPSQLDLQTYKQFLSDPELHFEVFFAVIACPGADGGWTDPHIAVWEVRAGGCSVAEVLPD